MLPSLCPFSGSISSVNSSGKRKRERFARSRSGATVPISAHFSRLKFRDSDKMISSSGAAQSSGISQSLDVGENSETNDSLDSEMRVKRTASAPTAEGSGKSAAATTTASLPIGSQSSPVTPIVKSSSSILRPNVTITSVDDNSTPAEVEIISSSSSALHHHPAGSSGPPTARPGAHICVLMENVAEYHKVGTATTTSTTPTGSAATSPQEGPSSSQGSASGGTSDSLLKPSTSTTVKPNGSMGSRAQGTAGASKLQGIIQPVRTSSSHSGWL